MTALMASMGLAGLSRPAPLVPDVAAARFIGPSGHRAVFDAAGQPTVVETSHHSGAVVFSDTTLAGIALLNRVGYEAAKTRHWVTETRMSADRTETTVMSLDEQGLAIGGAGEGIEAVVMQPAMIEIPAKPHAGQTWQQTVQAQSVALGVQLTLVRRGQVVAAPASGPGCLRFEYADKLDGEVTESNVTRCPAQGIVGLNNQTATDRRPQWPQPITPALTPTPRLQRFSNAPSKLTNGPVAFVPSTQLPPVAVFDGFAIANRVNGNLDLVMPTQTGFTLTWRRRPGERIVGLLGSGDMVVTATSNRQLVAYDRHGRLMWYRDTSDTAALNPLQIDATTMGLLTLDGYFTTFELSTGRQRWRQPAPAGSTVKPAITTVDGEPVVVLAQGRELRVLASRRTYLRVDLANPAVSVAATPQVLVVADADGSITVLDHAGRTRWTTQDMLDCRWLQLMDEVVTCSGTSGVRGWSLATGTRLWEVPATKVVAVQGTAERLAVLTPTDLIVLDASARSHLRLPRATSDAADQWLLPLRGGMLLLTTSGETTWWKTDS